MNKYVLNYISIIISLYVILPKILGNSCAARGLRGPGAAGPAPGPAQQECAAGPVSKPFRRPCHLCGLWDGRCQAAAEGGTKKPAEGTPPPAGVSGIQMPARATRRSLALLLRRRTQSAANVALIVLINHLVD